MIDKSGPSLYLNHPPRLILRLYDLNNSLPDDINQPNMFYLHYSIYNPYMSKARISEKKIQNDEQNFAKI